MNKKEFVQKLSIEDTNLAGQLYEKYRMSLDNYMKVGTEEFLPPNIWSKLVNIEAMLFVKIETIGAFEYSERRQIYFVPLLDDYYTIENDTLKIKLTNSSTFKTLSHKDYLGSVMSLGIKRELLSDLVVEGSSCYFMTNSTIASLIETNLKKAGKMPIEFEIMSKESLLPKAKLEEIEKIASSTRLDSIVATLSNVSRNEAVELISKKEVIVDYVVRIEKKYQVKEGSIISIRKIGKFIFDGQRGATKKERLRVVFKKFT